MTFGPSGSRWESYAYAGDGQSQPTATLTPDGDGIQVVASFVSPVTENWEGLGLFLDGSSCLDASQYTGVKFDISGDLGGCLLAFGANFSGDQNADDDPVRGACIGGSSACYPPAAHVELSAADAGSDADAGDASALGAAGSTGDAGDANVTVARVPFTSLSGGSPNPQLDPSTITSVQWQLSPPSSGGCAANFSLKNVAFY